MNTTMKSTLIIIGFIISFIWLIVTNQREIYDELHGFGRVLYQIMSGKRIKISRS
jgi:hypothetical protein